MLKARAAAFKEQDTNPDAYKKSRHDKPSNRQSLNSGQTYMKSPAVPDTCVNTLAIAYASKANWLTFTGPDGLP